MSYRLKPGTSTITHISSAGELSTGIKVPSHIKFTPPSSFTGGTFKEIIALTSQLVNYDLGVVSAQSPNTLLHWTNSYEGMIDSGEILTRSGDQLSPGTVASIKSRVVVVRQFIKENGDLDFNKYSQTGVATLGKKAVTEMYDSYSLKLHNFLAQYAKGYQTNIIFQVDSIIRKMAYINDIVISDEHMKTITRYSKRVVHEPISLDSEQIRFILDNRDLMKKACKTNKQKDLVDWIIIGLITGARYSDILQWTPENLVDVKGQWFLHYTPQKTSKSSKIVVRMPLPVIAMQIFNMGHPSYKLMPFKSNCITRSTRELLSLFPIFDRDVVVIQRGKPVTKKMHQVFKFHWLRSSAATYMISSGVPQDMVRSILGHSMSSKAFNVYATVLDREKAIVMSNVWK